MLGKEKGWLGFAKTWMDKLMGNKEQVHNAETIKQKDIAQTVEEEDLFINTIFEKVITMMRTCPKLSQQQQLALYGLYKQATEGDNNRAKPSFYEFEALAKYEAWNKCKGMTKKSAKVDYIKHANLFEPRIGERLLSGQVYQESEQKKVQQGGFGSHVPRPSAQAGPSYDHPYIQAMAKDQPINTERSMLRKYNTQPYILPLHYAIDNDKIHYAIQFVKMMEKQDLEMKDGQGMTALQYAELLQNKQAIQLLKKARQ